MRKYLALLFFAFLLFGCTNYSGYGPPGNVASGTLRPSATDSAYSGNGAVQTATATPSSDAGTSPTAAPTTAATIAPTSTAGGSEGVPDIPDLPPS